MNAVELKREMLLHGDKSKDLAQHLGMAESTFSCKLYEKGASFRKSEISAIIKRYNLSAEKVQQIFFDE